jgi:diacylglycerol kinase (ATP)
LQARGSGDVALTRSAGDERGLAREAAAAGATTIIALGGDGTWSNVARGILDARSDTRLALVAGGTGNDLAHNVGAPAHDIEATLSLAFDGPDRSIDVGYANETAFVNCCGVGFDVAVIQAVARGGSSLGQHAYLVTAARLLWRYRAIPVAISPAASTASYLIVVIGNGARFGGGMLLAPNATVDDGMLDLVAVRDAPVLRRLQTLVAAAKGRHLGLSGVEHGSGATFELRLIGPPLFEVDGELVQADRETLHVRCERQRLRICAP